MNISEIFLATDFSEHSYKAEQKAKIMSQKLHVPLNIVYILDTEVMAPGLYYEVTEKHPEWMEDVLSTIRKKSKVLIEKLYKELEATGQKYIVEGKPKEKLTTFIQEHNVELLIMGKRGKKQDKNYIGSVSSYVTSHTDCPILLVS